jgi:hypothetical protein
MVKQINIIDGRLNRQFDSISTVSFLISANVLTVIGGTCLLQLFV